MLLFNKDASGTVRVLRILTLLAFLLPALLFAAAAWKDRATILNGLEGLRKRASDTQGQDFMALSAGHRLALMQELTKATGPERAFFRKFRSLTVGAYYTTEVGFKDIGYIGNVALQKFAGPPAELLRKLGLGPEST